MLIGEQLIQFLYNPMISSSNNGVFSPNHHRWVLSTCFLFHRSGWKTRGSRGDVPSLSWACPPGTSHPITESGLRRGDLFFNPLFLHHIERFYSDNILGSLVVFLQISLLTDRSTPEVKHSQHQATSNISNCGFKWLCFVERQLWQEEHKWPLFICTQWVHSVQVRCIADVKDINIKHNRYDKKEMVICQNLKWIPTITGPWY